MIERRELVYDTAVDFIVSGVLDRLAERDSVVAIGVAGGSGSGKTYCSQDLVDRFEQLGVPVVLLEMDRYFLTKDDLRRNGLPIDFDTPESVRLSELASDVSSLMNGSAVDKRAYVYTPSEDGFPTAASEVVGQVSAPDWGVILVEGLYVHRRPVRDVVHIVVYIDQPDVDKRMRSRIARDISVRHYSEDVALSRWHDSVEPGFERFIRPRDELLEGIDIVIKNRY